VASSPKSTVLGPCLPFIDRLWCRAHHRQTLPDGCCEHLDTGAFSMIRDSDVTSASYHVKRIIDGSSRSSLNTNTSHHTISQLLL